MSNVIVMLLLLGFSICVIVGLVTVLQSLINGESIDDDLASLLSDTGNEP